VTNQNGSNRRISVPTSFKVIAAITCTNGALTALASLVMLFAADGVLRIAGIGLLISAVGLVRGGVDLLARRRMALTVFRFSVALLLATFAAIALLYPSHNTGDSIKLLGIVGIVILVIYVGADAHVRQELGQEETEEGGE